MAYAIIRIAKLGSAGAVGAAGEHNHRLRDTPNADAELLRFNKVLVGSNDLVGDVNARLEKAGITPRKNAVIAVEHLITASPEFFNYRKCTNPDGTAGLKGNVNRLVEFERLTLSWLRKQYGPENLINVVVHKDESAPHIHAVIVPIVTKEIALTRKSRKAPSRLTTTATKTVLAARDLFGTRSKLRDLQSDFAGHMQSLGLDRGREGSRAVHTTVKDFYRIAEDVSTTDGLETARQLLLELGNRREGRDAKELKKLRQALDEAGMVMYKGKLMSKDQAEQAHQVEKVTRQSNKASTNESRKRDEAGSKPTEVKVGKQKLDVVATADATAASSVDNSATVLSDKKKQGIKSTPSSSVKWKP